MKNISSYIDYLPPVLWSQENDSSEFLGRMLCIFEKILTGIPDGIPVTHSTHEQDKDGKPVDHTHEHDDFEKTIDELYHIFNPWKTDEDFLPWLASWVALTLQKDWSEYQKRKLISEIVSIYQEHGLKKGLYDYLDIYTTNEEARPRIVIDDGDAVFRATLMDDGTAVLHTVAYSNEVLGQTVLLHPSAVATDSHNNYIVLDYDIRSPLPQKPTLWKVSSTGEIEYKTIPGKPVPMPNPIYPVIPPVSSTGPTIERPIAVVVDKNDRISVVDAGVSTDIHSPDSAIYRFNPGIETVIDNQSTTPHFPAIYPVDMILDGSQKDSPEKFVVLDRGSYPIGENPGSPNINTGQQIVVVSEGPLAAATHRLSKVVEPTALVMDPMGRFIVADAKKQNSKDDPADLVIVDPTVGWSETPLLIENNPLIFPTGLAFENTKTLLVCDTGYRLQEDGEHNKSMADPAAVYRIDYPTDLSQTATITRITHEKKLVNPTKMMIDRKGKLIITDKGEYNNTPPREWRAKANEFGISVLFSQQRHTSHDDRFRIRRGITNVVNEQKPVHTSWRIKS